MTILLICVTVYLFMLLFTSLSFLAQYPWVASKLDYVMFNSDMRMHARLYGSALSMWLWTAFLLGLCWPYVYFVRIKEALK